jgi:site-specific DNA recombinase
MRVDIDKLVDKMILKEKSSIIGSMCPENLCFDGIQSRTARLSEPLSLIMLINSEAY